MEKIESVEAASAYLKDGQVLCSVASHSITRFVLRNGKIHGYGDSMHYVLAWDDFKELFLNEVLYVYEKEEDTIEISKEKDEEYYGWYHK